jgi:hypothetical protein
VYVAKDRKRAVVIVNLEQKRSITATVDLPNVGTLVKATPEEPEAQPAFNNVIVPPRSAVVLMES